MFPVAKLSKQVPSQSAMRHGLSVPFRTQLELALQLFVMLSVYEILDVS